MTLANGAKTSKRGAIWNGIWVRSFLTLALIIATLAYGRFVYRLTTDLRAVNDGRAFYYGTRVQLRFGNAYDHEELIAEWTKSGAPKSHRPIYQYSSFFNPPIAVVLFAPLAILPWQYGVIGFIPLNFVSTLICMVLCWLLARKEGWSISLRLLFLIYMVTLPALWRLTPIGQIAPTITACLLGVLLALQYRRKTTGGILLALSLSKYTLSLPFLVWLFLRQNKRTALVAFTLFLSINILLTLPQGVLPVLKAYFHIVRETFLPGSANDPGEIRSSAHDMVHLTRLAFFLTDDNRVLAVPLGILLNISSLVALIYVLYKAKGFASTTLPPHELALTAASSLVLFYHRYYDLFFLIVIGYGLISFKRNYPTQCKRTWRMAFVCFLLTSYLTSTLFPFPLLGIPLQALDLPPTPFFSCVLNALLFVSLICLNLNIAKNTKQNHSP